MYLRVPEEAELINEALIKLAQLHLPPALNVHVSYLIQRWPGWEVEVINRKERERCLRTLIPQ